MVAIFKKERQKGRSGIGIILAVLVIIVIGVVYFATRQAQESTGEEVLDTDLVEQMSAEAPPADASFMEITDEHRGIIAGLTWDMEGDLFDVTGGDSSGFAQSDYDFENGAYFLHVEMDDLPDPESFGEGYFYEGWIVRRNELHIISTGVVEVDVNGHGENDYASGQDWSDHDFYVLTIEPDDGDPAPADHILEGELTDI